MPVCEVCGEDCGAAFRAASHPVTYPFLPGGYEVRSPDMVDDVIVRERIFHNGILVATAGDQISARVAVRWRVGADGKHLPSAPPAEEPTPANATKPKARTRPKPLETRA
jgi:hypothetical protein